VCQNQTLAESYAPVAVQLRNDIYKRVQLNQSEQDILASVIQDHGAFVAYKPPFEPLTWGLWLGPFLMLALGVGMVYRYTVKKRHSA
jgi:cytochrome c-type biogenesis protein CcmH